MEKKFWRWAAVFHIVLGGYLLLFIFFDSKIPWVSHNQQSLSVGVYLYLACALGALVLRSDALTWTLFFLGSLGSVLAVAAADSSLVPVLLAPGLAAAFLRSPFALILSAEMAIQFMVFLGLLLTGLYQNLSFANTVSLLNFGLALVLVNAVSALTAAALTRMFKETRRGKGMMDLMRVSSEMGSIRNYDKISGLLTTVVQMMFDADSFGLYVLEDEEGEKGTKKVASPRWIESTHRQVFLAFDRDMQDSVMGEVLRTGMPKMVHDLRQENDRMLSPLPFFRGGLFYPIVFEDEILGLIFLISATPGMYDEEQASLLGLLSSQVAVTLKNISLYQKTATMAITDSLTDLYTHGYFQDQLMRLTVEHKYSGKPLGLVIIDVDHFKQINDTYGHPQGDYVLRQLAGLVKSLCRKADIVSRYGGDEFVVILPDIDRISASAFAERVREAVHEYSFVSGRNVLSIAISAGVSTFPERMTPKEMIEAADEALYEAKKRGRNQIFYV